jgi:hypothetical protein
MATDPKLSARTDRTVRIINIAFGFILNPPLLRLAGKFILHRNFSLFPVDLLSIASGSIALLV